MWKVQYTRKQWFKVKHGFEISCQRRNVFQQRHTVFHFLDFDVKPQSVVYSELGTCDNCRDNVAMIYGQQFVAVCPYTVQDVTTPF